MNYLVCLRDGLLEEVQHLDRGAHQCHDGSVRYISEFRTSNNRLIGYAGAVYPSSAERRMRLEESFLARKGYRILEPA